MATQTRAEPQAPRTIREGAIVFFDGAFMPLEKATVNVATHALHYGTGCFEGIRAYWADEEGKPDTPEGKPDGPEGEPDAPEGEPDAPEGELYVLKLREHIDRFFRSCAVLRIQPPFERAEMADLVVELLRLNAYRSDLYIRPIAFKSSQSIKLTLSGLQDSFAIFAFPFGHYAHREGGLHVGFSSWQRIDDNAIPARAKVTGSYVNASLASDDAVRAGYDEALMVSGNGMLSEASSANVFLVRGGRLITPAVSEHILEGITREAVMTLARQEIGLPVEERPVGRTEVYAADEVFLSGTGVQIEPVVRVDRRPIGSGEPGPITTRLQALYAAAVRNRLPAYADWCTPVYGSEGRE
ncbi:MAG: branched-chain-amino-acid transaminase [Chloroflexi bacterium]|nr:branched-chain-amino-acid transaminase [Chloroflexota bacterium]